MLKIDLPQKLQQEFERAAQLSIPKIVFVTHSSKQLVHGSRNMQRSRRKRRLTMMRLNVWCQS